VAEVPINPAVLAWALTESGAELDDVASDIGVDSAEFRAWLSGERYPGLTQLRALGKRLHRQTAVFLLPKPPHQPSRHVQFRHPIGAKRGRPLTETERRFLRRATRIQEAERWLAAELERDDPTLPEARTTNDAESVAALWRDRLGVSIDAQTRCSSASAAFDMWRNAVEAVGVTVLQLSMGSDSCRGFSLSDERAPLIAVNTAWTDEARIFTLFHEFGHLLTRTDSACAAAPMEAHGDALERWCEAFAAALLIPRDALASTGRVVHLKTAAALARRLKVSLRATAIRLIELKKAAWSLYDQIPPASDAKRGGGGGTGRNRREIRQDEFGHRTTEIFVTAVQRDIITTSQAIDYLDIPSAEFVRLTTT